VCAFILFVVSTFFLKENLYRCCFCGNNQTLPKQLHVVPSSEQSNVSDPSIGKVGYDYIPPEIRYQTVEYSLSSTSSSTLLYPSLVFVIDTALSSNVFLPLLHSLRQILQLMPTQLNVGSSFIYTCFFF
jgi:hypothetical protein